jgi:hypothetical protein
MSKLMSVLGIILLAIGAALALVGLVNPAQMQVYGLTVETAAILLVGGILSIGLGGVIAALTGHMPAVAQVAIEDAAPETVAPVAMPDPVVVETPSIAAAEPETTPSRIRFPGFGRKAAATVAATAAVATEAVADATPEYSAKASSSVDETIAALEQAKADIANAIGGVSETSMDTGPHVSHDAEVEVEEDIAEEGDVEGELYVLEERDIRGRPARILSDHTVEAETDEGWMRFENLEHLNEYLDAAGEPA